MNMDLIEVNNRMFNRYFGLNTHTDGLITTATCTPMTIDKHSRWLGYVQGYLAALNLIDVTVERDYSRPLYQQIYHKHGIVQPTINAFHKEQQ